MFFANKCTFSFLFLYILTGFKVTFGSPNVPDAVLSDNFNNLYCPTVGCYFVSEVKMQSAALIWWNIYTSILNMKLINGYLTRTPFTLPLQKSKLKCNGVLC